MIRGIFYSYKPDRKVLIKEEKMKTRKFLVLFPAVFATVAIFVSCNSVGIAQETFIESLTISTSDGKGSICVQLDRDTPCGKAVNCKTGELIKPRKVEEIFKGWKYIETPGSPCNSFTADDGIPGNTRYYCSGGYCYPY